MTAIYFVEADFGKIGRAFVETSRDDNSYQSAVQQVRSGEWNKVITVLEVNEDEGTCRNVTEDVARDVLAALWIDYERVPDFLCDFIDDHLGAGAADRHDADLFCRGLMSAN